jgi:hypothetical protein
MAKQHKLTIADAHLQTILRAVTKLSWAEANPIIQSISVQLQNAEAAEKAAAAGAEYQAKSDASVPDPAATVGNGHDKKAPLI